MPAKKGFRWYNNGIIEICTIKECPEGFIKGRLPLSDEIKSHYKNNGTHTISKEKRKEINKKISITKQNKTIEAKKQYSLHVSQARKGKGKGIIPWNKGKKGVQTPWNKGVHIEYDVWNKGIKMSDKTRQLMSIRKKGITPWNKGKTYQLTPYSKINMLQKQYETKKKNNSFNTSEPEEIYYNFLVEKYGESDVIRQYSDYRYPFACDFYIKSLDLFIELNLSWTHGGKLFDANCSEDLEKLDRWKEKSNTSQYYINAIETWTVRDIDKYNTFVKNNLNFKIIYKEEDIFNE